MKKINFRKIAANAAAVFTSTLAGIVTANGLIKLDITPHEILILAVFPALIQAALAFCNEWKKEEEQLENCESTTTDNSTATNILPSIIKFLKKINIKDFILFDD